MRKAGWTIAAIVVGISCFTLTPITEMPYSCAYCRVGRADLSILGVNIYSTLSTNECSRWYSAHVEQSHSHLWVHGVHAYNQNLFGMVLSAPLLGHIAINRLSPATQLRVYKKFNNPIDAKNIFKEIAYDHLNEPIKSRDDSKFDLAHLKAQAILEWEHSGFPGAWDEWWNRYFAEHGKFWGF